MRTRRHFIVTSLLCVPFLWYWDWGGALLCMVAGWFVDIDHEVDYYVFYGKFTLSIKELSEKLQLMDHYYCPLHSWELVILLFMLTPQYPSLLGAGLGLCTHLILDTVANNMYPFTFFLLHRGLNDFRRADPYGRYNPY